MKSRCGASGANGTSACKPSPEDHASAGGIMSASNGAFAQADYERFLYDEAALLDEWRLDEWLALFVEGGTYEVPTAGASPTADSAESLFYIADDWNRLKHRVARLQKKTAHAEYPHSLG